MKLVYSGNELSLMYPEIAKEWDYDKNKSLTPEMVTAASNRRVWWICSNGHSYQSIIANRTLKNRGCPYCSGRKAISGYNDLATVRPDLAEEWDYEKNDGMLPSGILPNSSTKVWWKCKTCGYSWKATPNSRRGCPHCSSRITTSFPEQAILYYVSMVYPDVINRDKSNGFELDLFIPSLNTGIEYDGVYYHKKQNVYQKDCDKDAKCKKKGITLIRFRDPKLPDTPYAKRITCLDVYHGDYLENAIKELFVLLGCKAIPNFCL